MADPPRPNPPWSPEATQERLAKQRATERTREPARPVAGNNVRKGRLWCVIDTQPPPQVFTIFCHGTGGHRDGKCLELITEFGAAYWFAGSVTDRPINLDRYGRNGLNFPIDPSTAPTRPEDDRFDPLVGTMGDIVPGAQHYSEEYQKTFLILDGCGTSDMWRRADGKDEIGITGYPNPMPGDFWGNTLDKIIKCDQTDWKGHTERELGFRVSTMKLKKVAEKNRGLIYGDGWNDNICHALHVLRQLIITNGDEKCFPQVINLIGWSRGAVTALKLAYWIDRFFVRFEPFLVSKGYEADTANDQSVEYLSKLSPDEIQQLPTRADGSVSIAVNIFAIDPVPGRDGFDGEWGGAKRSEERFPSTRSENDYKTIPKIVNNCIITLALDERREGFHPLDDTQITIEGARDEDAPNVVWLPFPGIHRTQLRLQPRDPTDVLEGPGDAARARLTAVPKLVFDLAWRFLLHHGTKFVKDLAPTWGRRLDLETVVEMYSEICLRRAEYHETRNQGAVARGQGGFAWRMFTGYPRRRGASECLTAVQLVTPELGVYTQSPGFFVNEHHRWCFKQAYPVAYRFLVGHVGTHAECLAEVDARSGRKCLLECVTIAKPPPEARESQGAKVPAVTVVKGKREYVRFHWEQDPLDAKFTDIFEKMRRTTDGLRFSMGLWGAREVGRVDGAPRGPIVEFRCSTDARDPSDDVVRNAAFGFAGDPSDVVVRNAAFGSAGEDPPPVGPLSDLELGGGK